MSNEIDLFERDCTKRQKNFYASRTLCSVLDELVDDGGQAEYLETAAWRALVDDHGEQAVLDAIERAQEQIDSRHELSNGESHSYAIEV